MNRCICRCGKHNLFSVRVDGEVCSTGTCKKDMSTVLKTYYKMLSPETTRKGSILDSVACSNGDSEVP